jgi:hypothetical protein
MSHINTEPSQGLALVALKQAGLWRVGSKKNGGRSLRRAIARARRLPSTSRRLSAAPATPGGFGHGQ